MTVDEYMAELPPDRRAALEQFRKAIRAAAPEAVEVISYNMPAFKQDGRFLVSYAAFKKHYSLFPASDVVVETLGAQVAPYLSGRGTIRFPADTPVPTDLIEKIVRIRVKEHLASTHGEAGLS
jgi:uncharacterized protein YdhG (YjbR/CyaY superfamily)